ncbi:hypothetical protein B9J78_05450 [bacterium Unc6]|nr:hypothetical protein [bacterium Unc6]
MIRLVIFDLDGTLVDDYETIQKALNYTLLKIKIPEQTLDAVKKDVGLGLENMLSKFIPEGMIKDAVLIYREKYSKILGTHTKVLPFVEETLKRLKELGVKIAVASNKTGNFSRKLVKMFPIHKHIDLVLCGDDVQNHKPAPELLLQIIKYFNVPKEDTLYVGDMTIDIETGKNAGIKTIAVLTGSNDFETLKKSKAEYIHQNISCVLQYIT